MTFSKLGTDTDTGQFVYLPKISRLQGLYIIGIQGTGKSGLIENLIMQDIDQQIGVCVLDPHGELIDHVIARLPGKTEEDKVILFDLANYSSPFGLNLFECSDPTDDGEIVKTLYQVLHVFEKAYGIVPTTPLMYDLLYHTVYTLIANPGYTMLDIRLLLTNEACRKKLAAHVPNDDIRDFWTIWDDPKQTPPSKQQEDRKTILNKMNDFLHVPLRNIVGQSTTTFDLEDIMNTGKILLVKLSRRLEQPSNLIGSIVIAQLLNAAYARPTNKRKQIHLYADEFQNFATEDFATLLEEARKFGIGTTIAHQNRGQLNSANSKLETDLKDRSRSVGSLVVFKINSKDADDLAGEFDCSPPPAKQEEAGRLPILVHSENVVDELNNKGHTGDSRIMEIFNEWIRPLLESKQLLLMGNSVEERPHDYQRHTLNRFLVNAMTGRTSIESVKQKELLADIVLSLREKFGIRLPLSELDNPIYPTYDETVAAIRTFISNFTNGNFPSAASNAFFNKQLSYWLKDMYIQAHRHWQPLGKIPKTAEEERRLQLALKQDEDDSLVLRSISSAYETVQEYYSYFTVPYRSPSGYIAPPRYHNDEVARYVSAELNSLEQIAPMPPEAHTLITQLKKYVAWWQSSEFIRNPNSTQDEKYGGKLRQLTSDLLTYYQKLFPELKKQKARKEYQEAVSIAFQAHDPVMIERYQRAEAQAKQDVYGRDNIPHFVKDMFELAALLHAEPVRTESGQYEVKYRPGTVRPYQDVKNDIANQLSGLLPFTARVKISGNAPQNPGKKCLNCGLLNNSGALHCAGCGIKLPSPNEYTLVTIKPAGGINAQPLQQRIASIQARNLQEGYARERTKVEAEIIQRQTQCSGSPAQPQQQPRHARQVPLQGKCPDCGASNSPGAKFCNQCGTKLH